jgi:hypothetical protein
MRDLARVLALAGLIVTPLAARAESDPATATPLSELEVVAKPKPQPTPLSELDVVIARKPPTVLSGIEVKATPTCLPPRSPVDEEAPAPRLVSTYPARGQTVQPGYVVLRLTFDLPMACRGSLSQSLLKACFADDIEIWRESLDRRSLMILCDLQPNAHYELAINRHIPEHFQGLSGREPDEGLFAFETSGGEPVTSKEALVGRDPQLAAIFTAAAGAAVNSPDSATTGVSIVKVQETTKCLEPRNPPDPEVPAPKMVSTFPAQGQTVRPGLLEVRFTFDLPMACMGGVEIKDGSRNPCTELMTQHLTQPWDRHSMRYRCRVEPGKRYVLMINKTRVGDVDHGPWPKMLGLGGKPTEPYELTFWTSNDAPVQTQDEADEQDPLMAALLDGHEPEQAQ